MTGLQTDKLHRATTSNFKQSVKVSGSLTILLTTEVLLLLDNLFFEIGSVQCCRRQPELPSSKATHRHTLTVSSIDENKRQGDEMTAFVCVSVALPLISAG